MAFLIPTAISLTMAGLQMAQASSVAKAASKAADREAQFARQVAQSEAEAQRQDDLRTAATQRSLLGASGVQLGSGSPLLVELETARQIGQRVSDRIFRGEVSAFQSKLKKLPIRAERDAALLKGAGTIATSAFRGFSLLQERGFTT